jgi:hypothetical protein
MTFILRLTLLGLNVFFAKHPVKRSGRPFHLVMGCFLQVLFGQSCKTFLDIVACPNWTKLQRHGCPV